MKIETQQLKQAIDELLAAHNDFEDALWRYDHSDHEEILAAQRRIDQARIKCAMASRAFDKASDVEKLSAMWGDEPDIAPDITHDELGI